MQLIPRYDYILQSQYHPTENGLIILVTSTYFFGFIYVCQFGLALHNIWAFLVVQKRYKTPPLVVFYIIVILLSIARFYFTIWCLPQVIDRILFTAEIMPILKVNLGFVQCWILTELYMRIKLSTRLTDLRKSNFLESNSL